jgi:hypothetical protein
MPRHLGTLERASFIGVTGESGAPDVEFSVETAGLITSSRVPEGNISRFRIGPRDRVFYGTQPYTF